MYQLHKKENVVKTQHEKFVAINRQLKMEYSELQSGVIKDFTYLTLKKRGKPMTSEDKVMRTLLDWVVENIPKGDFQKALTGK